MTVIAFDGRFLAADRQVTTADSKSALTKLAVLDDRNVVVAWNGDVDHAMALIDWYVRGADPEKWPAFQRGPDWVQLIVGCNTVNGPRVVFYDREPSPVLVEGKMHAWGSGRAFALGAMFMGASASDAVRAACQFSVHCGLGGNEADLATLSI